MTGFGLLLVTILSGALAAVMTIVAWRVARDESRRADARIAALAAEIHADTEAPALAPMAAPALPPAPARRFSIDDLPLRPAERSARAAEPFRQAAQPPSSTSRLGLVAATGAFVFASLAAIVIWLSPGTPTAPIEPLQAAGAPAAATGLAAPLELIALGHEREGDRLNVRGVIRNPLSGGKPVDSLAAVITVYSRTGAFVMSARAPLPATSLAPGTESTFLVAVPDAADVGRYRVSFRTDDRVVPHIDKRGPAVLARAQ